MKSLSNDFLWADPFLLYPDFLCWYTFCVQCSIKVKCICPSNPSPKHKQYTHLHVHPRTRMNTNTCSIQCIQSLICSRISIFTLYPWQRNSFIYRKRLKSTHKYEIRIVCKYLVLKGFRRVWNISVEIIICIESMLLYEHIEQIFKIVLHIFVLSFAIFFLCIL